MSARPVETRHKLLMSNYGHIQHLIESLWSSDCKSLLDRVYQQRLSKLYVALSTLIFTSLCSKDIDDLETYIIQAAAQIPSSLFDLNKEWLPIMSLARECRYHNISNEMTKILSVVNYICGHTISELKKTICRLSDDISTESHKMRDEFAMLRDCIKQLQWSQKNESNLDQLHQLRSENFFLKSQIGKFNEEHTSELEKLKMSYEAELDKYRSEVGRLEQEIDIMQRDNRHTASTAEGVIIELHASQCRAENATRATISEMYDDVLKNVLGKFEFLESSRTVCRDSAIIYQPTEIKEGQSSDGFNGDYDVVADALSTVKHCRSDVSVLFDDKLGALLCQVQRQDLSLRNLLLQNDANSTLQSDMLVDIENSLDDVNRYAGDDHPVVVNSTTQPFFPFITEINDQLRNLCDDFQCRIENILFIMNKKIVNFTIRLNSYVANCDELQQMQTALQKNLHVQSAEQFRTSVSDIPAPQSAHMAHFTVDDVDMKTDTVADNANGKRNNSYTPISTEASAILIQSFVRRFISSRRVTKLRTSIAASDQGILIASMGTVQGETGWYASNGNLYYFLSDQDDFILLCGPISKSMYDIAQEEISSSPRFGATNKRSYWKFSVDRLGIHATRIQIETLLDDLRNKDRVVNQMAREIASLNCQLKDNVNMDDLSSGCLECRRCLKHGSDDCFLLQSNPISKFVKLTSIVRGFLGRCRVKKIKLFRKANETGVLVALKNTTQGESGWYAGPNGSIFYFVLKNEEWIHVAGPIAEKEFESLRDFQSHTSEALYQCRLPVTGFCLEKFGVGNIYISNVDEKLYLTLPLNDIFSDSTGNLKGNVAVDLMESGVLAKIA